MEDTDQASREMIRIWRVYKTVKQMCQDRGYQILDEEIDITLDQFRSQFTDGVGGINRGAMTFTLQPTDEMREKLADPRKRPLDPDQFGTVFVEFNGDANLGIKPVKQFVHEVGERHAYSGILITAVAPTSASLKISAAMDPKLHTIEIFQESELVVNITRHELVPRHVLLGYEEKKALLERYRLKESQLPRIQRSDPVAKYLGLRRGQVVKIIRKSETAGRYASYRWCI
ncbi:RPB5 subunit of DNA-directed RNA polymerase [Tothia fuscella]|uniref:DNA-directed RNA polymerases I, II, and III subunit RPABC1 n=1 Tax=Tothia fuscella TaxID=1048955 RepID=A0A9P4U4S7_9PEZI|nr:RPB5 subunit of DNA-directed RNA polymerase [Tothia fuscella]